MRFGFHDVVELLFHRGFDLSYERVRTRDFRVALTVHAGPRSEHRGQAGVGDLHYGNGGSEPVERSRVVLQYLAGDSVADAALLDPSMHLQ